MKFTQSKNITSANNNRLPFFRKERNNNFYESNNNAFFNSSSIQAKLTVNQPNDPYEKEADTMADKVVQRVTNFSADRNTLNNTNNLSIQRKCADCEHEEEKIQKKEADTPVDTTTALPQSTAAIPAVTTAKFIVDDNAVPGEGQMRKTDFLNRLKDEVSAAVKQASAIMPFSSANFPDINAAFASYQNNSAQQLEQLSIRYEPSSAQAQNADDLIRRTKMKVYTDALQSAGGGVGLGGPLQIPGGIASGISSVAGSVKSGFSAAMSGIGKLLFKENAGGAAASQSPGAVMQSLGKGHSIESGTRGKMEGAFGNSFSNVEIHTDDHAAHLSRDMNARAFAVGNHIAFANGEYNPGNLLGDALLAHELAHTIQQSSGVNNKNDKPDASAENSLETEADSGAVEAVATIWAGKGRLNKSEIRPKARKGLSISRCFRKAASEKKPIDSMDLKELNEIINNPAKYSLGEVGAAKARAMMLEHRESIAKTGKGTIQGNQCATPASPGVAQHDCTTYVLDILKFAFKAKGLEVLWNDIFREAKTNSDAPKYDKKGFKGTELIASLVGKAGWKAVFWSPDPRNPNDSPADRPRHSQSYKDVNATGIYYGVPVEKEDSVVNYRRTNPASETDKSKLDKLKRVPLAIIAAKGGMHMTVLINGIVYEVHYKSAENDPNAIEATPLESWGWNSGVLVMPESDYKTAFRGE